jgi:peptidoglycan/xylan/chitin deacetylase (PgdA/CDA1 family)
VAALVASCLLVATAAGVTVQPGPAHAATQTIVTIEFDDGRADQAVNAGPILAAHNAHGTFFINTGLIGTDSYYMTWDQVAGLAAAGNEIAGHTLTHANIANLSYADARYQVCQDRVHLFSHRYQPTSFAYPSGGVSDTAKRVVQDCGYNRGRTAGGISKVYKCAEPIPPADPYATRAARSWGHQGLHPRADRDERGGQRRRLGADLHALGRHREKRPSQLRVVLVPGLARPRASRGPSRGPCTR